MVQEWPNFPAGWQESYKTTYNMFTDARVTFPEDQKEYYQKLFWLIPLFNALRASEDLPILEPFTSHHYLRFRVNDAVSAISVEAVSANRFRVLKEHQENNYDRQISTVAEADLTETVNMVSVLLKEPAKSL